MCNVDDSRARELLCDVGANDAPYLPCDIAVEGGEDACFLLGSDRFDLEGCISCDNFIVKKCLCLTVSDSSMVMGYGKFDFRRGQRCTLLYNGIWNASASTDGFMGSVIGWRGENGWVDEPVMGEDGPQYAQLCREHIF